MMFRLNSALVRRHSLLSFRRVQTTQRETWLENAFDGMTCEEIVGRISPPEFLTHPPIALDVDACLAKIERTLNKPEPGRSKELVAVARGTATGKTTAIEWMLREARLRWTDTLCLGVTFNHHTAADMDLAPNLYKFNDWPMTYAVGIVARMAVGVFGESLEGVYEALRKPAVYDVLREKTGELDARKVVRSCVEYLLERTGKTKIFLALDEALAAEEALLDSFPPSRKVEVGWKRRTRSNYDALSIVRVAVLDPPAVPRGALVVSSLERINPTTDSTRKISSLPVPARLEPAEVLSQWWFVDCSAENSSYDDPTLTLAELRAQNPRKTIYKPANPQSEFRLKWLALLAASLPRGLEYMKAQLDIEMEAVPAGPDGLKRIDVQKDMADRIQRFAREEFAERHRLRGVAHLPSPSVMYDWLFNRPVQLSDVSHLIRQSLFTNSVTEDDSSLCLESCVLSWSAVKREGSGAFEVVLKCIQSLVQELQSVCGSANKTQRYNDEPVQEGTPLEVVTMHILQIKLAALVAAGRGRSISIKSLLYPSWGDDAVDAHLAEKNAVFRAEVSLPEEDELMVQEIRLSSQLNAEDPVPFFEKLNEIDLTTWRFRILRGAPGDCFDVGLLFIDARTGDVCLWLGDMKSAAEDTAPPTELQASLLCDFSSKKETAVQTGLVTIREWLEENHEKTPKSTQRKKTGDGGKGGKVQKKGGNDVQIKASGRALTEGRVLFSYLSTHRGRGNFTAGDATRCDVTVVGRDVVEEFVTPTFFPFYALFRSVAVSAAKQVRGERPTPPAKHVRDEQAAVPAKHVRGKRAGGKNQ